MKTYTKIVDGKRKIFGTWKDVISDDDKEVVPNFDDTKQYLDDGKGGIKDSDGNQISPITLEGKIVIPYSRLGETVEEKEEPTTPTSYEVPAANDGELATAYVERLKEAGFINAELVASYYNVDPTKNGLVYNVSPTTVTTKADRISVTPYMNANVKETSEQSETEETKEAEDTSTTKAKKSSSKKTTDTDEEAAG